MIDLHMHSDASDGTLSPSALVELNQRCQVQVMALTDHDTLEGQQEAEQACRQQGIHFISGVELSVSWSKHQFHLVGLNFDRDNPALQKGIDYIRQIRDQRAEKIAQRLAKAGIENAMQGASELADGGLLARPHFARYLVQQGIVKTEQDAFDKYLKHGKPGFVPTVWAGMQEAVGWINAAGGDAVLAHPLRYNLTGAWLRRALDAFREAGGAAIEVVCGQSTSTEIRTSAAYAERHKLKGSVGSDFHSPEYEWIKPGKLAKLPQQIEPVWANWQEIRKHIEYQH
jgi:hypothetical protein